MDEPLVSTGRTGRAIKVRPNPEFLAIAPGGRTAYVLYQGSGMVTPISLVRDTAGQAISVGLIATNVVFTPDGKTAYVLSIAFSRNGALR